MREHLKKDRGERKGRVNPFGNRSYRTPDQHPYFECGHESDTLLRARWVPQYTVRVGWTISPYCIEQIKQPMAKMDSVTQQDVSLGEDASAAAQSMSSRLPILAVGRERIQIADRMESDQHTVTSAQLITQRVLDTVKIAMSMQAPPPRIMRTVE